uniref:Uncharacterized protein n=1 Tax=Panagrolaimus superbus TaxID=310955 RepID=A0A914Z4Q9_9BILA
MYYSFKSQFSALLKKEALQFFAENKFMVVKDIEHDGIEFYSELLGCRPVAFVDQIVPEALGTPESVEEIARESLVKVTGVQNPGQAVSILLRGSNKLVLDEADRSLHDAFCVVRCLVKKRALLPGGGAPEMEVAVKLRESRFLKTGLFNKEKAYLAYADAMEFIPYTLAGNAGLSPIETGIELRRQHANGNEDFGINVRKGAVTNIKEENVLQPLLVTSFAIKQASETVRSILKIDDIVSFIVSFSCNNYLFRSLEEQ